MTSPVETLNHNGLTIEIHTDSYPQNPRDEYDHLGTLALKSSPLGDEVVGDLEEWLIASIPTEAQDRIERIDALIDQTERDRSHLFRHALAGETFNFTEEEKRREVMIKRLQGAYRLAPETYPKLKEETLSDSNLPLNVRHFLTHDRLSGAMRAHREHVAGRLTSRTSKRLDGLVKARTTALETGLDQALIGLAVDVYDQGYPKFQPTTYGWGQSYEPKGYIYMTWDRARKEFGGTDEEIREKVLACLKAELDEFNAYLYGDVYGFTITDETGEKVDSCWGFYGLDYCKEAAQEAAEGLDAVRTKQLELGL